MEELGKENRMEKFCPLINSNCKYGLCVFYLLEVNNCLKVIAFKDRLGILSQKEKRGLTTIRQNTLIQAVPEIPTLC